MVILFDKNVQSSRSQPFLAAFLADWSSELVLAFLFLPAAALAAAFDLGAALAFARPAAGR